MYPLLALLAVGILVPGTARLAELIGTSPRLLRIARRLRLV